MTDSYHYPPVDPSLVDDSVAFTAGGSKKRRLGSASPDDEDQDVKPLQAKDAPGAKGGASEFVKKLYRFVASRPPHPRTISLPVAVSCPRSLAGKARGSSTRRPPSAEGSSVDRTGMRSASGLSRPLFAGG